jgi:hypothetical protein
MAQVWDPRLIHSRKVGFFIQDPSCDAPLANVRCNSHYPIFTSSVLVISMPKGTLASRRFVWCTSRHVAAGVSVGRWDTLLYGASRRSRVHFFRRLFSQSRQPQLPMYGKNKQKHWPRFPTEKDTEPESVGTGGLLSRLLCDTVPQRGM